MAAGWARVVTNENQLLSLVLIDVDDAPSSQERLQQVLVDVAENWAGGGGGSRSRETEYCIDDGAVYICRLVPDKKINDKFVVVPQEPHRVALKDSPALRGECRSGKITFRHDERSSDPLGVEEVEIQVRAIGLNREDANAIAGSDFSSTFSHEVAGVVVRIGSAVPPSLAVGDTVFGFSFDTMATTQRTRHDLLQRMTPGQTWRRMAAVPMACTAALYAVEDLARLKPNQTVVIIDGYGVAAMVAIQLCNAMGASTIVVAHSESTVAMLRTSTIALRGIINPKQEHVSSRLQHLTNGKGIDVLLCSASTDASLIEECSRTFAPFGRIVLHGPSSRAVITAISTANYPSIMSFDIRDLYHHRPQVLSR